MKTKTTKIAQKRLSKQRLTTKAKTNRITEVVHKTAQGLYQAGVMDRTTMHEFDALCLPEIPTYSANQIRAIRARCKCSQSVFAKYMNVTASSLRQWEAGTKKPAGMACKLLNLIERKGLDALG